jgi:hypothetical protein
VNSRALALAFAVVAIVLTVAQDVWPARDWYHGWQYITLLALALVVMLGYAWSARAGADGIAGKRLALAAIGASVTALAGLLSGLIGPDTVTVVGTPGTVTPVADLGIAAFFGAADAGTIARGEGTITLRKRGEGAVAVGTSPLPLGLSVAFARPVPAAYVVARDLRGNRLTVTQPTNPSFLSPVLLFRQQQPIRDKTFPMDTFAAPAAHRVARALYFSPADLAAFRHGVAGGGPGVVLSVVDDAGATRGLTIAPSGVPVTVGDLRLTVTLGTYPELVVASAPQPFAMLGGIVLFLIGCVWALLRPPLAAASLVSQPD